nr:cytochrome P450 [Agasicles hygrophila]
MYMRPRFIKVVAARVPQNGFSTKALDFGSIPTSKWRLPIIGSTLDLILSGETAKYHKYMDRKHRELGPIFKDNIGPTTAIFVSDAHEIRNIFAKEGVYPMHYLPEAWAIYNKKHNFVRGLLFMDGPEWLHFRRIVNPILLGRDLAWLEQACDISTNDLIHRFELENGREIANIEHTLYRWSIDVIVGVLVGGSNYKKCAEEVGDLLQTLAETVHRVLDDTVVLQFINPKLAEKFNLKMWRKFEESVTTSTYLTRQLLGILINKYQGEDGLLHKLIQGNIGKDLDRIIIDLIMSAGDTTSYTMTWILYLLCKNQDVIQAIRESEPKSHLLRNSIKEALRLHPVAPFINRYLPKDVTICGYNIPAKTLVTMSFYSCGRNPEYFKHPDRFLPNRWVRGSEEYAALPLASIPFGLGARSCIGRRIAENQLKMTTEKLIRKFEIQLLNADEIDDVMRMISKPSKPLRLVFRKID